MALRALAAVLRRSVNCWSLLLLMTFLRLTCCSHEAGPRTIRSCEFKASAVRSCMTAEPSGYKSELSHFEGFAWYLGPGCSSSHVGPCTPLTVPFWAGNGTV